MKYLAWFVFVSLITLSFVLAFNTRLSQKMLNQQEIKQVTKSALDKKSLEKATFAGGCFWCTESDFEKLEGVAAVISGFAGGNEKDPSYESVASGQTSHREAVQVMFDPEIVSYEQLLDHFWRHVDPTDDQGQFVDRGFQYASAIFYHDENQKNLAEISLEKLKKSGIFKDPILTPIIPVGNFYPAEAYHQDFYLKQPLKYKFYRYGSGRDQFLESVWGKVTDDL